MAEQTQSQTGWNAELNAVLSWDPDSIVDYHFEKAMTWRGTIGRDSAYLLS
jgi:hypothetical protein